MPRARGNRVVFGRERTEFVKKRAWKTKIKKACIEAGTSKPYFDYVIDTLAGILEKRDQAQEQYDIGDEPMVIEMTNKSGFANKVKNPLISIWDDLNKSALSYWRDLGLTPAGLKKLNEESFAKAKDQKAGNSLLSLLAEKKRDMTNE